MYGAEDRSHTAQQLSTTTREICVSDQQRGDKFRQFLSDAGKKVDRYKIKVGQGQGRGWQLCAPPGLS